DIKKYKIFEVITDIEDNYYIFAESTDKAKEWVKKKYENQRLEKLLIRYTYSTDNLKKAKEMAEQV
ncbi:MAG: hypothetical protein ACOCRK_06000, partial [bacterium]